MNFNIKSNRRRVYENVKNQFIVCFLCKYFACILLYTLELLKSQICRQLLFVVLYRSENRLRMKWTRRMCVSEKEKSCERKSWRGRKSISLVWTSWRSEYMLSRNKTLTLFSRLEYMSSRNKTLTLFSRLLDILKIFCL